MAAPRYDAFLSHNTADKPAVEALAHRLRQAGLEPWLDKWNLVPGEPWQAALADALDACATCVVFIGPGGIGPWQNEEMRAAIDRRVSGGAFRVIPVLLPGAERDERSRLPSFLVATTWVEFRDGLDDADAFHRLVCGVRGVAPGPGPTAVVLAKDCPYRGLQAFDVKHAPFFFGREALTDWLLNDLRPRGPGREPNRFLAVVGASGSGKSSLARAGLLARLGERRWPQVVCWPGPDPLESVAVALAAHPAVRPAVPSFVGLVRELEQDAKALHRLARVALHDAPAEARLVLLVDQFEEAFTQCPDEARRRQLIDNLAYAATVAGGRVVVVLTLRADFYGQCAVYPELAAALSDHQALVGPLGPAELRQAIERPALLSGCEFEPGLAETLIRDVERQPGALPLLQHTLAELWERRDGRRLTFAAYEAIGRLHGALERRANAVFDALDDGRKGLCQRIFLRLTQPGDGTEDSKRRATLDELVPAGGSADDVRAVLLALADARLVTVEGNPARPGDPVVEVAHEALIRGWSRLRQWIEADREALRTHRKLTADARDWSGHGRNESYLYHGVRLAVVEEWLAARPDALSPLEREFVEASRKWDAQMLEWRQDAALRNLSARSDEMLLARQIQQRFLPTAVPRVAGLEVGYLAVPAAAVGGDLYDFFEMGDGRLAVLISDVAGHGFAPALMMAHLRACLRTAARVHADVAGLVALANRTFFDDTHGELFATLFLAVIDPAAREFSYVGAGEQAYLLDGHGRVKRMLDSTAIPLGIEPSWPFDPVGPIPLDPGDRLVLVTDGVREALDDRRALFGWEGVLRAVAEAIDEPTGRVPQRICAAARAFAGEAEQADDMTAVVVKIADA